MAINAHSSYFHCWTSISIVSLMSIGLVLITVSVQPSQQCQQTASELELDSANQIAPGASYDLKPSNNATSSEIKTGDTGSRVSSSTNAPPVSVKQPGILCPMDIYPLESFPPKAPIIPDIFTVAIETVYLKVRTNLGSLQRSVNQLEFPCMDINVNTGTKAPDLEAAY